MASTEPTRGQSSAQEKAGSANPASPGSLWVSDAGVYARVESTLPDKIVLAPIDPFKSETITELGTLSAQWSPLLAKDKKRLVAKMAQEVYKWDDDRYENDPSWRQARKTDKDMYRSLALMIIEGQMAPIEAPRYSAYVLFQEMGRANDKESSGQSSDRPATPEEFQALLRDLPTDGEG